MSQKASYSCRSCSHKWQEGTLPLGTFYMLYCPNCTSSNIDEILPAKIEYIRVPALDAWLSRTVPYIKEEENDPID